MSFTHTRKHSLVRHRRGTENVENFRKHKMNKSNREKRERCEPQTLHNSITSVWRICVNLCETMNYDGFFDLFCVCMADARVRNLSCRMKFEYMREKGVEFVHTFHSYGRSEGRKLMNLSKCENFEFYLSRKYEIVQNCANSDCG